MEIITALIGFALGATATALFMLRRQSKLALETQSKIAASELGFQTQQAQLKLEAQTWKTKYELTQVSAEQGQAASQLLQNTLKLQFESLAQKIFDEKSTKMTDQNFQQLNTILSPLKERIKEFEQKVNLSYDTEQKERSQLKGEILKLIDLNQTMSKDAQNLTLALKGENKTQGNWGELILENILERSGLRKNEEYFTQETLTGADGKIQRPDVIVRLPDGKHLIVDSKVTLVAYEASVSASNASDSEKYAIEHVESLKRHVSQLSEKKYHLAEKIISPDFVMLFMPLEPAFAMAFRLKPDLFEQAWDKNVAIVSPTTLLSTLRTVSSLWKQERQQQNALEIAKLGGALYDKFAGIVKDMETMGKQLDTAKGTHDEILKKMNSGRGNLISQVEKLKELGVKADKSLPPALE
jgi:DNA recombination protein RmuC